MISTRIKYNRNSKHYNLIEYSIEKLFYSNWRKELFQRIDDGNNLEVGVGTGKNIKYYPQFAKMRAIDFSEGMLSIAAKNNSSKLVDFVLADLEQLPFPSNYFDNIIATFVFCSVPNPIRGFEEIKRVIKPNGKFFLLEHVLPKNLLAAHFFNILNYITVKFGGVFINRQTSNTIKAAGLKIVETKKLFTSVFNFYVVGL